jgi:hypothetical protein
LSVTADAATPLVDRKVERLRRSGLFPAHSDGQLLALSRAADLLTVGEGELLVNDGQPGRWWWMVIAGELELTSNGELLESLLPGDTFAPEAARRPVPFVPMSLVARSAADVLVSRPVDLHSLIRDDPSWDYLLGEAPSEELQLTACSRSTSLSRPSSVSTRSIPLV